MSLPVEVVEPDGLGAVATVGVFAQGGPGDDTPALLRGAADVAGLPDALDPALCARDGFRAKVGQVLRLPGDISHRVLVLGLGPSGPPREDAWRRAAAAFVRAAGEGGDAALVVPEGAPGSALAEGAALAAYRFDAYRTKPSPGSPDRVLLVASPSAAAELRPAVARGLAAAEAVSFARDLVNTPASDLNPTDFATRVAEYLDGRPGVGVEVWDESRIEAERLGGLRTVARGSVQPPRVVRATYTPTGDRGSVPHVVLVGKGITFDSGGLSLKTADGMMTMKTDMTGAAIVMAVVSACGALEVPVKVTALAMVTENMPGPDAVKPGDVFRARNGSTIEVLNTDAEGRLVLADGLSLAAELEPDAIIDVATLTGAQVVALGRSIGALFGSDQRLKDRLQEVGDAAGEPLWQMPLPEEYADHIDSEIADMKNMGRAGEAGSIAAAMLLSRFVGESPWAHLDIAGPSRVAEPSGYLSKGGTAFGARTLLEFLRTGATADPA